MKTKLLIVLAFITALLPISPTALAATRTWSGLGLNNLWANPLNWDVLPVPGDDLVFPPGAARLANANNYPSNTTFRTILLSGSGYALTGNTVALDAGLFGAFASGSSSISFPVRLNADQSFSTGLNDTLTLSFATNFVDLNGHTLTCDEGGTLSLGLVTGTGNIIKTGAGRASLTKSNSFSGTTLVSAGTLEVQNSFSLGTTNGDTTVTAGGTLQLFDVTGGVPLIVPESLTLSGTVTNIQRANTWSGPITLGGSPEFAIRGTLTLSGSISGSAGLTKSGLGALALTGTNNSYTGVTLVTDGLLLVNSFLTNSPIVLDGVGASLNGTGTVGLITFTNNGGILSPGTNAEILNGPGILTCSNVIFNAASSFSVELNGTTPRRGYDQLNVHGSVNLANATLNIIGLPFPGVGGETFKIIDNDGIDAVVGTFNGLSEGSFFTVGAQQYQITYIGGDGNDVVLLAITPFIPPTGVTETWTGGGGADTNWSNNANWSSQAPQPGDDLVFPGGSGGQTNFNDIAAGTTFNSITLSGSTYFLDGNSIILNAGISNTAAGAFGNTLNCPVLLALTNSTVFVATNSGLTLSGALAGSGGLIKTGLGKLTLSGTNANAYASATVVYQGQLDLNKSPGTTAIPAALVVGDGTGPVNGPVVSLLASDQIADTAPVTVNNSGLLTLNGRDEAIGPLTMDGGQLTTSGGLLTLNGDVTRVASAMANFSAISGRLSLGGATRTFNINTNTGSASMSIVAPIIDGSGSAGLIKTGLGVLVLSGSNVYTGPTIVAAGLLSAANASALGAAGGGTIVSNGATLNFNSAAPGFTNDESSIIVFGTLRSVGSNTLTGSITLGTSNIIIDSSLGGQLTLSGVISGSGGLIKKGGSGVLQFAGPNPNTYLGTTELDFGPLVLNKAAGVIAVPGPLRVLSTVRLLASDQISDLAAVTLLSAATLDVNGFSEEVGSLSGGIFTQVTLGSGVLTFGGDNSSTSFVGTISGAGGNVTKTGSGVVTLAGTNTYSGITFVQGGALLVNGSQPASMAFVFGGTLGGSGSIGPVAAAAGAIVSPGASPGVLSTLDLNLAANSIFAVEINGANPGTGYDQLKVTGSVNVQNARLALTNNFAAPNGAAFVIISNDGLDPVTGTFFQLPEGGLLTNGGGIFRLSYHGGDGNDVTLTRTLGAPSSTINSLVPAANGFKQLTGQGQPSLAYIIEATPTLSPPIPWSPISTNNANASGVYQFLDTNAPMFPMRFYRVRSP